MTRGLVSDAEVAWRSGVSVSNQVPGLYLDDPLYLAFCAAIDELLGPALLAVDCFGAYLDPELAPADFLPWLAGLVGSATDSTPIGTAVAAHGERGTPRGLRACVAAQADVALSAVTVVEPGGVTWSAQARDPSLAGAASTAGASSSAEAASPVAGPRVVIRVVVEAERDGARLADQLRAVLTQEIPAHCSFEVEVSQ